MFGITRIAASCPQVRALTLAGSVSVLALATAGGALAQAASPPGTPAPAAQPSDQPASQTVTVTGTRIRGVAPVGSAIVTVNQQDVKRSGLTDTAALLEDVPSVLNLGTGNAYAGGSSQGGDQLNSLAYGQSLDIRGFGPQATLTLVNGHRMAYEGANMNEFDPDNYPLQMISHIDIVEDGTSPLYGADAIAGTANIILRAPFKGAEAYAGYGNAKGQNTWFATGIIGDTWDLGGGGGFVLSYQHTYQDALKASAHPDLYNDDFAPYGGAPSPDFAAPGNVIGANGVEYAIPAGQNGSPLTLSQLGAAGSVNRLNSWTGIDAVPQETADHVALNWNQDLTPWLQLFGDGLYTHRVISLDLPGTENEVSEVAPSTNPYSPCNPLNITAAMAGLAAGICGSPAGGPLTVHYNDVLDAGPQLRYGSATTWELSGGAHVTLPYDWKATVLVADEDHQEPIATTYGASAAPSAGAFNFFCDPTKFSCNAAALTAPISGGLTTTETDYHDWDFTANFDGPLFKLPGGDVRLAVGAEYYHAVFTNINNIAGGTDAHDPRNVTSGYGELYIPLVGPDNAVPGIYKLELDVAGRIDDYSDVGETSNPKIGLNWSPTDDLKLHASYGTSFRAPGLADNDPNTQHIWFDSPPIPGSEINSALCTGCGALPGGVGAVYTVVGGANHDLKPETSTSYSIGADWTPKAIPGLTASVNYWWVNYTGQINFPVYNAGVVGAINQQYYNKYIIYNPALFPALAANNPTAFFGNFPDINTANPACAAVKGQKITTTALFNAMITCENFFGEGFLIGPPLAPPAGLSGSLPGSVLAVEDGRRINSGITQADGFDLSASYQWRTGMGAWRVAGNAEYINDWKVGVVTGAPLVQEVNRFGYPLTFKGRAELSWNNDFAIGNIGISGFLNYANAYKMDAALLPAGIPLSYANINSYTTVDLTLNYSTNTIPQQWLAQNVTVTLSVQNLFDTNPPLVLNQGGAAGAGILFDPANASPLGRVIQIQIGKKF
jgi:iron complex outermembrane receptor protein